MPSCFRPWSADPSCQEPLLDSDLGSPSPDKAPIWVMVSWLGVPHFLWPAVDLGISSAQDGFCLFKRKVGYRANNLWEFKRMNMRMRTNQTFGQYVNCKEDLQLAKQVPWKMDTSAGLPKEVSCYDDKTLNLNGLTDGHNVIWYNIRWDGMIIFIHTIYTLHIYPMYIVQ